MLKFINPSRSGKDYEKVSLTSYAWEKMICLSKDVKKLLTVISGLNLFLENLFLLPDFWL